MRWSKSCIVLSAIALGVGLSSCPIPFGYYTAGNETVQTVITRETPAVPVATPTFLSAPVDGGAAVIVSGDPTEDRDQEIAIACATEGAVVYYTVCLGTPVADEPPDPNPYSPITRQYRAGEPIIVSGNSTVACVKAIGFKSLMLPSSVAMLRLKVSYTTASSPSFDVPAGTYNEEFSVTISESTPGAIVWFTVDGSQPIAGGGGTTSSGVAPISLQIAVSTRLRAVATAPSYSQSSESSAIYTLATQSPVFSTPGGVYGSPVDTVISAPTAESTIWYTLDGSDPDPTAGNGIESGSPIPLRISETTTVNAVAVRSGWSRSPIATAAYCFTPPPPPTPAALAGITQVSVSWQASPTAISYNLYYQPGSTVTTGTGVKIAGASSPRTVTGLAGGTQYAFIVTGVNGYGEGLPSPVRTSTPLAHQCIVDIKLYDLGSAYAGPNPTADGYYLIPQDLNQGAGGNFIYVLVKYGRDSDTNPPPVTGIHVVNADMGDVALPGDIQPTGFCDLNHLAGGDFIYLYFSRGGPNPLRSLATKNTSTGVYYYSTPTGIVFNNNGGRLYTWVDDRDLNAAAGGDDIYFGYSFDFVD